MRREQIDAGRRLSLSKIFEVELFAFGHYGNGADVFSDVLLLRNGGLAVIIPISDWRTHHETKPIRQRKTFEITRANLELQTELKRTEIEKSISPEDWRNRPLKLQNIVNWRMNCV